MVYFKMTRQYKRKTDQIIFDKQGQFSWSI